MFTRYWRNYPWFLQLFLFVTMMFTFLWLGRAIVWTALPKITGVPLKDFLIVTPNSPLPAVRISLLANSIIQVCFFTLPPLLFAYFTTPFPGRYLGLRLPGRPVHWIIVTCIMLGYLPLSLALEGWLQHHVDLGKWAKDVQALNDKTFSAYLRMNSVADLAKAFAAFAVIPPIGEELLFRGIIMRFAARRAGVRFMPVTVMDHRVPLAQASSRMIFPILISALLFALMHSNPYGAIFIFTAGVLLALIYWLTGSLFCSIWAHMLFNGTQVVSAFFSGGSTAATDASVQTTALPVWLPIAGAVLFAAALYALFKTKTPLQPDWSADYSQEELNGEKELR